jgi:ABC-type branched-subunit amino acid transport system substrate-binding protein
MIRHTTGRAFVAVLAAGALVAACGGDDGTATETTADTETTAGGETTTAETEPVTTESTPTSDGEETTVPPTEPAPTGWTVNTDDCVDPDAANAPIEGTIKLGSVMPLSNSPAAAAFAPVKDGLDAYIKYANDNDLLNGVKIELTVEDDEYNKDLTPTAVTKLSDAGTHVITGIIGSPNNAAVRDTLNDNCIPQLLALTGSPAWGEIADYPWTMGALVPYTVESQIYATQIGKDFPDGAKVALFHVANEFGEIYAQAFKDIADDFGIEIVDEQTIEAADQAPPVSQVTSIAAKKPDVVMAIPLGAGCIGFLTEMAAAKTADPSWQPATYLTNTCASGLILGAAGPAANGLITSTNNLDVLDPANAENPAVVTYLGELEKAGKVDVAPTAVAGWNVGEITVAILQQAMASPDGLTQASIINASRNFTFTPGLSRPGVELKLSGEDDVFLAESLQVITYDATSGTFSDIGELITDYES